MLVELGNLKHSLLDFKGFAKLFLPQTEPFDLAVSKHQGLDHDRFADFLGLAFDHADRFFSSGDDQV